MDDRVHPLRGTALALRPTQAFLLGVRVEEKLAGVTQSPRRLVGGLEATRSTWTHAPSLHTPTYAGCWMLAAGSLQPRLPLRPGAKWRQPGLQALPAAGESGSFMGLLSGWAGWAWGSYELLGVLLLSASSMTYAQRYLL